MIRISIAGIEHDVADGDRLVDAISRAGIHLSQVCYLPQSGPIQTCDTCVAGVNGELVRACGSVVAAGMNAGAAKNSAHPNAGKAL